MTRYEYVKTVLEPRFKDEDELYHHGILGMKWGVRRYQNEDGSLTPEGRKRYYGIDSIGLSEKGRKEIARKVAAAENAQQWGNETKSKTLMTQAGKMISDSLSDEQRRRLKEATDEAYYADDFEEKCSNSFNKSGYRDAAVNEAKQMARNEILENPQKHPYKYSVLTDPNLSEEQKDIAIMDNKNEREESQRILRDQRISPKEKEKLFEQMPHEESFGNMIESNYLNTTEEKYWNICRNDMQKYNKPPKEMAWNNLRNTKIELANEVLGEYGNKKIDGYELSKYLINYIK